MIHDGQLLRDYADRDSQPAFAEFVQRHLRWVYQAGLRRTGGRHDLAQEVAHYAFTAAARSASTLSRHASVAGWLHITVRHAASRALRAELRRRTHETAAHAMIDLKPDTSAAEWEQVRPALDEMMDRLPSSDREPLLLRFFENLGFAEIGAALGLSEDAARKRVDRALEKLRRLLARRGVASTSSALGALLTAKASAAVAPEIQATVIGTALSGVAVPGASTLALVQFMSATKAAFGGAGFVAAILCLTSGGIALYQTSHARAAEAALTLAHQRHDEIEARLRTLERDARAISASALPPTTPTSPPSPTAAANAASSAPAATNAAADAARATRRADGQAFLNSAGGKVRAQYRERIQRELQRNHALFFRVTGLPLEKQQAMLDAIARQWEDTLEVTPTSLVPGVSEVRAETLRALLGDDGYRAWQDFHQRAETASQWAMNVAQSAGSGGVPLSLDQIATLQRIVCENSADYRAGRKLNDRNVDWTSALRQAAVALSPAQWQAAQPFLLMRQATHALEAAADAAPATTSNPGKP